MPPLLVDLIHARACKPFCEKSLTLPFSNTQICISIPVHFAFFNVIIGKRKPPKEQSLWRFWCARLDSNQRPTESELSGRQRRNPGFMRASGISHKVRTRLQKSWEPLVRLGSHGFSGFWEIVVKQ